MNSRPEPNSSPAPTEGSRRAMPATGLPTRREKRGRWGILSALLHLLLIFLLTIPVATHTGNVIERDLSAGGAGPSGGGGGGHRGTGGAQEHVTYINVAPAPAPVVAVETPVVPPAVIQPVPPPVVPPPEVVKAPEVVPDVKTVVKTDVQPETPKAAVSAPTPGAGGGSGRDGSAGNGPGTGGGVGSGNGTGRGSGNGPGTGGGSQVNYPPSPTEMFIPPLPFPDKVRGFHLIAEYDVDETGKVLDFTFTPTRDGGYNKRLEDVLKNTKFRPGTKPDGTPIRMKAQIIYDF